MKQVLLVLSVSLTLCLLQSCSTKESPAQFVQNYYRAICNGEFESLGNKLDLVSVRKEVFESYNKKVIDFFGSKAGEADIDKLAGLFEIVEIAEQIADDKKSARVNYTLKVNGDQSYNMQVALTRGDEGWKIIPKQGILNFLGYEDLLLFMPSLDNNLSDEELASFQKVPQKVDYSSCVAEAGKKGLFEEMLTRLNQKSKGTYADATVVDAEEFGCFKEGLCAFRRGNFWGFMDVDGKVVIEPRLNYPEYTFVDYDGKSIDFPFFSYGLCLVFNEGGWPIYINKKGEVVIDGSFRFMLAAPFVGNYANVGSAKLKPTNTYPLNEKRAYLTALNCYIDRNGQIKPELGISEVLGAMKAQAFVPREGLSAFRNNEALFGFWDINRKVVIPAQFTAVKSFSDGMAWVEKKDDYGRKKWGAIDRSGKVLVEFIYDEAPEDFHNGRAAVKPKERDKAADFIDTRGKTIFSTKYNDLFSGRKVFKLGLLGDKDINGELVMSQRTAYAFPVAKLQLFMPDFDWKDADVDEIFYTDLRKGDIELASLSWKYGDVFVYGNKRFFDYGQTDEQVLFEGFRGADGNFKIIRYR